MKIRRKILKIRSRFYYYTLVALGSLSILSFSRCNTGPSVEEKMAHINDSVVKVKALQDSIVKADSIVKSQLEHARLDSVAKADSIAKAKKPKNTFKPQTPITKYGIPITPLNAKYGVVVNAYKD